MTEQDITFTRLSDGCVAVHLRRGEPEDIIIDPHIWASIVCGVSAGGEGDYRWYTALRFHDGSEGARHGPPDATGIPAITY